MCRKCTSSVQGTLLYFPTNNLHLKLNNVGLSWMRRKRDLNPFVPKTFHRRGFSNLDFGLLLSN